MGKHDPPSSALPDLPNKPGKTNWVEKAGGLPSYIKRVAKHIFYGSGFTVGRAIAAAVSQVKKWAAKGNKQAIAAIAEWEKKRASGHIKASVLAEVDVGVVLTPVQEVRLAAAMAAEDRGLVGLARVLEAAGG